MKTHSDKYYEVVQSFKDKSYNKMKELDMRENELGKLYSDINELTLEIRNIPSKLLKEVASNANPQEKAKQIIDEGQKLRQKREALIKKYGYPSDYLEYKYDCELCSDTGFVNGKMCSCFKKELAKVRYSESGLERLIYKQSFENFDLKYYSSENRDNMQKILQKAKAYASDFNSDNMNNLLFIGKTGLGKTHISTSIAKVVMDNGYDVVYETAQNIFTDIETDRYTRTDRNSDDMISNKYYDCDLLIIDDLGTEVENKYNLAGLYHLINSRIVCEKSTIINTNLDIKQIYDRYEDRITSRLLGEYNAFEFKGKDVRFQKINK